MSTNRARTLRHRLATGAALATTLVAINAPALAMEEVIARGTTAKIAGQKAEFEAEMASYARAVEIALRNAALRNLENSGAPTLRLARVTESHRG